MGVVANLAWLVRAFARQQDVADILWAYSPSEDETQGYTDELNDETNMMFDKEALAEQLEVVLKDLNGYDEFINSLDIEEGVTSSHSNLKRDLAKLITIAKMGDEGLKDYSLINKYREDR